MCAAFSILWDEASQKVKPLVAKAQGLEAIGHKSSAPKAVQVMVQMSYVFRLVAKQTADNGYDRRSDWQLWLMLPWFSSSMSMPSVVASLAKSPPANLTDPLGAKQWFQGPQDFMVACLCFDYASSNTATPRHVVHNTAEVGFRFMVQGERCATHCVHLVKAHCSSAGFRVAVLHQQGHAE